MDAKQTLRVRVVPMAGSSQMGSKYILTRYFGDALNAKDVNM